MPYKGIHVCVLNGRDYDSYRVETCGRKVDGKCVDHRYGLFKNDEGKTVSELSELWFREEDGWSESQARSYCREQDGQFEPAIEEANSLGPIPVRSSEFRFVGSPRNPYGTHASKGYPGGRAGWQKAWRIYLSCVRDQGPIQGTIRRVSMIAAGMKPKCNIPTMSAEDVGPRQGKCGCLEGKVYQKPSDYGLSKWKKPSDDDLEQEDIQLTCQDLTDIKRICLQEIAKRQACAEEKKSQPRVIVSEMGIERRFMAAEVRVVEDGDGQPHIQGYGAVFNEWSLDLGGFRESIEPGAFTKTLQEADVRSLWNHNVDYILGRNKSGTLRLYQDERGLGYDVIPPDAQWARDLIVSIMRGDVSQASFGFETLRDKWDQDEDGNVTRRLLEVKLYDVGPVTFAAYPQTSAEARSKAQELQRSTAAPGQGPHPAEADDEQAQARLDVMRRRLDLAEMDIRIDLRY